MQSCQAFYVLGVQIQALMLAWQELLLNHLPSPTMNLSHGKKQNTQNNNNNNNKLLGELELVCLIGEPWAAIFGSRNWRLNCNSNKCIK